MSIMRKSIEDFCVWGGQQIRF
ncbi:hypothetical protein TNCV_2986901 [Trichonephila clavipes]|nr:hypothetical protein TNCV_2986901 [Trichonephila clavipes]